MFVTLTHLNSLNQSELLSSIPDPIQSVSTLFFLLGFAVMLMPLKKTVYIKYLHWTSPAVPTNMRRIVSNSNANVEGENLVVMEKNNKIMIALQQMTKISLEQYFQPLPSANWLHTDRLGAFFFGCSVWGFFVFSKTVAAAH